MKRPLLALAAALAIATPAFAQGDFEQRLKKKLESPWLKDPKWITDYDEAKAEAKKTGKVIFGFFSPSYAFSPACAELERGVLSSPEFKEFAKSVVLFAHITSRVPDRKDDDLLSKKGGRGFPYFAYMDRNGDLLGRPTGLSIKTFAQGLEKAQRFLSLQKKEGKNSEEQLELFELEVGYGKLTVPAAKAKREKLKLPPELDAKLAKVIRSLEADQAVKGLGNTLKTRADVDRMGADIGKGFYEDFHLKGSAPATPQLRMQFYFLIFEYGVQKKVLAAAEVALSKIREQFAGNPRARLLLERLTRRAAQLKAEKAKKAPRD